jgi:hypothetical protein
MIATPESAPGSTAILELPAPAPMPERPAPQDDQDVLREAGDFIARHVLEQDAILFDG